LFAKNAFTIGKRSELVNKVMLSSSNELLHHYEPMALVTQVPIAHNLKSIMRIPQNLFNQFFTSLKWAIQTRNDLIIFIMPSPFDLLTMCCVRLINSKIVFVCHETQAHEGEFWPTKRAVKRRIALSARVVTLSMGEYRKVVDFVKYSKVSLLQHPIFEFEKSQRPLELDGINVAGLKFLFVGRFKRYKGIDRLISAWRGIENGNLFIVGEGEIDPELPANTILINRWVSEAEIAFLIDYADVVVFPYTSGSQSGLLPYVIGKDKIVVASKVEGLEHQLSQYHHNTYWVETSGVQTICDALQAIIDTQHQPHKGEELATKPPSMVAFLREIKDTWENANVI
jgi:glycosyltransferase involved in cell wall biosynthesis